MRNYLLLNFILCSLLISTTAFGQASFCGTTPTQEDIDHLTETREARQAFADNIQDRAAIRLPITNHVVRRWDGTGGISTQDLADAIQGLNDFYAQAGIEFYECGPTRYIDNGTWYDLSYPDEGSMTNPNNVANTINIYHCNSINIPGFGGACGYAYFPAANKDIVVMANACTVNGSTLIHELGHYLSLYHTHGKNNCTAVTDELVNGSNCSFAGDDVCDTPADPCLSGNVNSSCAYTGNATDANGQFYNPQTGNIMSYSLKGCRSFMTQQQLNRAAYSALNDRDYLSCDDVPPPTTCEILTNGGFDNNLSNWSSWNCTAYSSGGTANLTSITTGANPWNAGLVQVGFTIQQGKTYTATFRARAASNRSIFVKAGMTGTPWTSYFYQQVNLTTSMQTFTITFTMNNPTDTNARFEFFVANASPSVYIDNVSLEESDCGGNNCPAAGTACNDNNPATYNDVEDGNCNCAGTPCPAAGTSCNDGNPNTENDVQDGFCNCAGTPIQSGGCELLTNGGFDSNLSNWSSWNCTASASGGTANLTSITTGANPWNAGLVQVGFTMVQGKTYTATFRARAASNRSIFVKTGMTGTPWTSYFYEEINLTTSMQTFTITFTMSNPTDTNARFEFFVANASPSVYIDNVSLEENDCASSCEILTNGDFNSNLSDWNSWNCTASASGGAANLTSISTGANPWDAGLLQVGFTMEQGKTYTATFRARAASNRSIFVKTGMTGTPWTSYFYEEINLTTSMQTFTITFLMDNPTDTNARFEFFVGTDSPSVYIDDVSLTTDCGGASPDFDTPDLETTRDIQLYPNPANHTIQLAHNISDNTPAQIKIFDLFGKKVEHITGVELLAGSPTEVNISQLPAGVYFCTLESGEWQTVKKFVIAR